MARSAEITLRLGPRGSGRYRERVNLASQRPRMGRRLSATLLALCAATWMSACGADDERVVRVYAAASLREACEELDVAWTSARPEVRLSFNYAASDVLAMQIMAGQRADLFLSADARRMDAVRAGGVLDREAPRPWLSNQLVVIVPAASTPHEITGAASLVDPFFARFSLGNVEGVPAGRYAKAWLESAGVWDSVVTRVVPAVDVRAALAAVESGACDVGIVYSTDAAITERVRVAYRVPIEDGPQIEYALATLNGPGRERDVLDVFQFLQRDAANEVFDRRGFLLPRGN